MNLDQDAATLLDQVEAYRQGECAKLLKEAHREANALVRDARREAWQRVHGALAALRQDARARIVAAEASVQARRRSQAHRATQGLLDSGWAALQDELARREARQMPIEEKRRRADAVVRNDGQESETFEQVQSLFQKWKRQ